jgi:hypothetical protein
MGGALALVSCTRISLSQPRVPPPLAALACLGNLTGCLRRRALRAAPSRAAVTANFGHRTLALVLALAGCSRASDAPPAVSAPAPQAPSSDAPPERAPREKIAGLAGFDSESKLVYAAAPTLAHVLKATYVFPDRARWWLGAAHEQRSDRTLHYRFGRRCFVIPTGSDRSQELDPAERERLIAQVELRRALMLWPDGFAWEGAEIERKHVLEGGSQLCARFADPGAERPREIALLDAQGVEIDALRVNSWQASAGRTWPKELELWHAGELIWRETIATIDTTLRWMDLSFLPPDVRGDAPSRAIGVGKVQTSDAPRLCATRVELGAGTEWPAAFERARALRAARAQELAPRGLQLDPFDTITVDRELRPTAVLVRLSKVPEHVPEGFAVHAERPVVWMYVVGSSQLAKNRLDELHASLPADARAGEAFVRFDPAHVDSNVGIYLPLESKN